tara:strand:+ start:750 stop:1697 length:948 start_codon:yes stop_codon:yes gene_type:complete
MTLDKNLLDSFVNVTSRAAIATYNYIGKKNKDLADKAAVDAMRSEINKLNIDAKIVIGEGELDEAPMLFIGEKLGTGNGISLDIAVDPLEGTNFVANNLPGGLSVLAISKKNGLFSAPETYMDKIAVGSDIPNDAVDLDNPLEINLKNIADARNKDLTNLTVCLLDRPRHKKIIEKLKYLKVKIKLITDGDVSGSLLVTDKKHDVDLFLGIGGGPEGVLSACALDSFKCKFQGRFIFKSDQDIKRAKEMGIKDLKKKYEINEIIKGDSIFCATGVTSGDLLNGIKAEKNNFITETFVTHKSSNLKKIYKKKYQNQ